MNLYRLYNVNNVFLKDVKAKSYVDAAEQLKPQTTDRIFFVEDDNHEIECGIAWIKELFNWIE